MYTIQDANTNYVHLKKMFVKSLNFITKYQIKYFPPVTSELKINIVEAELVQYKM